MGVLNRFRSSNRPDNVIDIREPLKQIPKGIHIGVQHVPNANGSSEDAVQTLFVSMVNHRPANRGLEAESWKLKIEFTLDSSYPIQHVGGYTRKVMGKSESFTPIDHNDFEWIFNAIAKHMIDPKSETGLSASISNSLALDIAKLGEIPSMTITYYPPQTTPVLRLVGS